VSINKRKINLRKIFITICLGVLLIHLLQVLYFQREVFFNAYDASYWKDRVEHSRYVLPLSDRGISDDQFYAYGGYKIMEGQDPTSLVYDKPALGVAIVGFFGYYLNNPAFSGLFFGLGILVLTYLLVHKLTKSVVTALATTTLLSLDPLFTQNLSIALLDLPQLFFLLLNIYLLVSVKNKKYLLLLVFLSGLALGIFAQIKIPVIYPFILALEIFWLYKNYTKLSLLAFIFGNAAALIIGYIPYAVHNYSFIEFLKIQKFVLAFYRDSKLPLHPEAIWQFLFFGNFPGVVDRVPVKVYEWSLLYPIATLVGVIAGVKTLFKSKDSYFIKSFAIILLVSLLIFTFIPSYPRYVIIILPFLYFFMAKAIFYKGENKLSFAIITVIFLYALGSFFSYYLQSPSYSLKNFYASFSRQFFQDVYQEHTDSNTRNTYSREEFKELAMNAFSDAKIRSIDIVEEQYQYSILNNSVEVPIKVTYKTEYLGTFTEDKKLTMVRENDKWRVKWDWEYLLDGYSLDTKIESTRIIGKRGSITTNAGKVVAEDSEGYLVSLNPRLMDGTQEKNMLDTMTKLSYLSKTSLQDAYLENPRANTFVPLFTTTKALPETTLATLLSFKGVKVEKYPTRTYSNLDPRSIMNTVYNECCTRIYSSYNYHGNKKLPGPELTFDKTLAGFDGGSLVIRNKDGEVIRTIIDKDKKDGEDITIQ
jgi:hypothetical protein